MAKTIPGAWANLYLEIPGNEIVNSVGNDGLDANYLNARWRKPLVANFWHTPLDSTTYPTLPPGQANGARWWALVTPPWTVAYWDIIARSVPGVNPGMVTLNSRSGGGGQAVAGASFAWYTAGSIAVSSTGVEEFYLEFAPGAGEVIYVRSLHVTLRVRAAI